VGETQVILDDNMAVSTPKPAGSRESSKSYGAVDRAMSELTGSPAPFLSPLSDLSQHSGDDVDTQLLLKNLSISVVPDTIEDADLEMLSKLFFAIMIVADETMFNIHRYGYPSSG
jgi:hypothetical protein